MGIRIDPRWLPPWADYGARVCVLAAVYAVTAALSVKLVDSDVAPVWPCAGIGLAALITWGRRLWPGVGLGAALGYAALGESFVTTAAMATGQTLEALAAAWLMHRFVHFRNEFHRGVDVFKFVVVAAAAGVIAATIGVASHVLDGSPEAADPLGMWRIWWQRDAAGMLAFAPLFLLWMRATPRDHPAVGPVERTLFCLSVLGASLLAFETQFSGQVGQSLLYLLLPVIVWGGLRFTQRGVATAVAVIGAVAVWETLEGTQGPFVVDTLSDSLLLMQTFISTMLIMGLTLAAFIADRRRAFENLKKLRDELADRVRQRTAELEKANETLRLQIVQRKSAETALQAAHQRLQEVSKHLVQSSEAKRHEIAHELNEELGQVLAGVGMRLGALQASTPSNALAPTLDEMERLVRGVINRIQRLARSLAPSEIKHLGLAAATEAYLTETSRAAGVVPHFTAEPMASRPPWDIEMACFRILEEALSNVLAHAGARNVWVSLKQDQDGLHLCIRDDGEGFDVAAVRRSVEIGEGLGLALMEQRAALCGGGLEIVSAPGKGTELHARLATAGITSGPVPG